MSLSDLGQIITKTGYSTAICLTWQWELLMFLNRTNPLDMTGSSGAMVEYCRVVFAESCIVHFSSSVLECFRWIGISCRFPVKKSRFPLPILLCFGKSRNILDELCQNLHSCHMSSIGRLCKPEEPWLILMSPFFFHMNCNPTVRFYEDFSVKWTVDHWTTGNFRWPLFEWGEVTPKWLPEALDKHVLLKLGRKLSIFDLGPQWSRCDARRSGEAEASTWRWSVIRAKIGQAHQSPWQLCCFTHSNWECRSKVLSIDAGNLRF